MMALWDLPAEGARLAGAMTAAWSSGSSRGGLRQGWIARPSPEGHALLVW